MGTDTPDNYLFCNGSTYSKSTYPDLYNVLKTETLPNLDGLFLQGGSTPNQKKGAGLPNITGSLTGWGDRQGYHSPVGALGVGGNHSSRIPTVGEVYGAGTYPDITFDASKMTNSLYGKSTTVQPPALTVRYIIRAK